MNEEENFENEPEKTDKKKNFKDRFFDFVVGTLAIASCIGIIGLIGFLYYESIVEFIESNRLEYNYFYYGIITFSLFTIYSLFTSSVSLLKKLDGNNMFDFFYFAMPLIFFAVAVVLIILINILIFLLSYWFIWVSIILIILLIIILYSETSVFHKIALLALIILTIYFFFQAKDILEFKFTTYFNNKNFFPSWK